MRILGCWPDFFENRDLMEDRWTRKCTLTFHTDKKFLTSLVADSFSWSIIVHEISMLEPEAQPITHNRLSQMSPQTHSNLKHTVPYNVFAWVPTLSFCSRLTPAYLFVLGLVEVTMRALHNDSVFEPTAMDHLNCENYWWRNALYINSLYPRREMVS
jgi:hypothetical protein